MNFEKFKFFNIYNKLSEINFHIKLKILIPLSKIEETSFSKVHRKRKVNTFSTHLDLFFNHIKELSILESNLKWYFHFLFSLC
jgi:hypothetical protein